MSLLYYKLKNAIEQQSVTFDGSVIQIGDVKRLVAEKQGLGPDGYQEITLYDPNTGTEYDDDGKVVPRNTLVEVKRTPAATFAPLGSAGVEKKEEEEKAGTMGEDESQALQSLMQGTASTWQKEVRQGVARGRGRGKGTVPAEYRCPRCEAYGAHWIQDCPTHGDPTYDRKRVRPPVGIPMTRLARSMEGGLVLPDGNTGTLVANEEAFAKEVLGIGAMNQPARVAEETLALEGPEQQQQAEEDAGAGQKPTSTPVAFAGLPFSIAAMAEPPKLAGMSLNLDLNGTSDSVQKKDDAFFDLLKNPELPRGPKNFLLKAYDRDSPLSRREFEREQRYYRKDRDGASRSPSRHRRERKERSRSRSPSRRKSRSSSRRRSHRDSSTRRRERRRSYSPRDGVKRSPRKRTREDMDVSKPEDSTLDTDKVSDQQQTKRLALSELNVFCVPSIIQQ